MYNSIREKLLQKGIPENEVAFIHDANTEVKKDELFKKVRSGDVRVLLGSTAKNKFVTLRRIRMLVNSERMRLPKSPGSHNMEINMRSRIVLLSLGIRNSHFEDVIGIKF